ncbi:hypothetical protein ElyMa_001017600 [Elysia marginata]|uniref:Uncharacterized protein n=1 Tax=Elysia marginata TaxID=1093978 RepID=A0AAV4HNJ9_9GAST|nr:hypothetical protein ElyMa_001017600 [Elysia marginata]
MPSGEVTWTKSGKSWNQGNNDSHLNDDDDNEEEDNDDNDKCNNDKISNNNHNDNSGDDDVGEEDEEDNFATVGRNRLLAFGNSLPRDVHPDAQDEKDFSGLVAAGLKENFEAMALLLEHGADVNRKDASGKTP